jgi:hypothetical protein
MSDDNDLLAIGALCDLCNFFGNRRIEHENHPGWKRCIDKFKCRDFYVKSVKYFLAIHRFHII